MAWLLAFVSLLQCLTILGFPVNNTIQITATVHPLEFEHRSQTTTVANGDSYIDPSKKAVHHRGKKWPGGRVAYTINNTLSPDTKSAIVSAMRQIEDDVRSSAGPCIQFVEKTTESSWVEILDNSECLSTVGMANKGRSVLSIGYGCEDRGTILHELLHVLGFYHEQNRYDRDAYINLNFTNILPDLHPDFTEGMIETMGPLLTRYDFKSILHYGPYFLAKDSSLPVITPKPGKAVGVKMGQRLALSDLDVLKVQRWYQCQEDTTHITQPIITSDLVSCNFEDGICNLQHDKSSTINWKTMEGASQAGPRAGSSNGDDPYLIATPLRHDGGIARITTPVYSGGSICIDFSYYQKGPTSYLKILASGPAFDTVTVNSFQGQYYNGWVHPRISFGAQAGVDFQLTFEAHITSGDVAIDDLTMYQGGCV